MNNILQIAGLAKEASVSALHLTTEIKNRLLTDIYNALKENKERILNANLKDVKNAERLLNEGKITLSLYKRLILDENKFRDMVQGVNDVSLLEDPVNKVMWSKDIAEGITLKKITCPIGVLGIIFEARPDVISQIISLSIKTSNAVILKGGSEAEETNKIIFNIIKNILDSYSDIPSDMINLIHSREDVKELLSLDKYINLIIPRGSNSLVKYIKENTKIPVLGHSDGICHIYIDEFADESKALKICIDAKCQYPSACNSVETVLVHKSLKDTFLNKLKTEFIKNDVKVNENLEDWSIEYGDKTVSLKIAENIDEAIMHINKYGSGHTDCIITENDENAEKFMLLVDSAGAYKNISTRFADGFRYGFGAEVGISTNKIHARGPVGLEGLTIYKYRLYGNGDIVNDFVTGKRHFYK